MADEREGRTTQHEHSCSKMLQLLNSLLQALHFIFARSIGSTRLTPRVSRGTAAMLRTCCHQHDATGIHWTRQCFPVWLCGTDGSGTVWLSAVCRSKPFFVNKVVYQILATECILPSISVHHRPLNEQVCMAVSSKQQDMPLWYKPRKYDPQGSYHFLINPHIHVKCSTLWHQTGCPSTSSIHSCPQDENKKINP
jgi:hypothetical protein